MSPGGFFSITPAESEALEIEVGVSYPSPESAKPDMRWPGSFSIDIRSLPDGSDTVRVSGRVAPFLIPSSLDPVDEVLIVERPSTRDVVARLRALSEKGRFTLTAHRPEGRADVWMQDSIEPAVLAFPVAGDLRQVFGALTGIREKFGPGAAELDEQMQESLQERGFIAVRPGVPRKDTAWIDWYGNLEVTPAHTSPRGRKFPYGRLVTGRQGELGIHPGVLKFLEAQRLQWPPIEVDTSWLLIGHADEVVSFVPAGNAAGFRVLLPSPSVAQNILHSAIRQGHGSLVVFSGTEDAITVQDLHESIGRSEENRRIERIIAKIETTLARELSLERSDFVRLPVLFEKGVAVIPNGVNSLVANGRIYVPDPRGPKLRGRDLFQEAIVTSLETSDVEVNFVDVWSSFHVDFGELHCGTSSLRRLRNPAWWRED